MTDAAKISLMKQSPIADVVIEPRGRRMSGNATFKYNQTGRQEGPI